MKVYECGNYHLKHYYPAVPRLPAGEGGPEGRGRGKFQISIRSKMSNKSQAIKNQIHKPGLCADILLLIVQFPNTGKFVISILLFPILSDWL